jgi:hypothetical protein
VVERGSQVLDCFSREQWPVVGRRLLFDCNAAVLDLLRRTTLTFHNEHISLIVNEGRGFPAKSLDVFYAPRELPLGRCLSHALTSP